MKKTKKDLTKAKNETNFDGGFLADIYPQATINISKLFLKQQCVPKEKAYIFSENKWAIMLDEPVDFESQLISY